MIKIKWKWLRRTLRVLAVSIFLIAIFVFFFLENIIINRLESKLENSYGDVYLIEYESLDYSVSFSSLSLKLKGVKLKTDTAIAQEKNNPILFIESKSLALESISLWNVFFHSVMDVDKIIIDSPQISIAVDKNANKEKSKESAKRKRNISKYISKLSFKEFIITNGSAEFFNDVKMSDTLFRLKKIEFKAENFNSFSENLSELLNIERYKSISVESESFYINFGEDQYTASTGNFKGELIKGDIELSDIHLRPPFEKIMAGKEFRGDIKINELKLRGVKYLHDENNAVSIDTAIIVNTNIDLTKNQALSEMREKSLWMESLLDVNKALSIKYLEFMDCSLSAKLLYLNDSEQYTLNLYNLNGTIENLNTKGHSGSLSLKATSNIFRTGKLKMNVDIPYNDPLTSIFNGTISTIDLKSFNELIGTAYPLKIDSGKLNKLTFKGSSNKDKSKGVISFEYSDLEGSFLKEKKGEKKRAVIISAIINMYIHASNPRENEESIEKMNFTFSKKTHQGQLMLWLGGVLDGVIKTIVKEKKHDFIMRQMDE